VSIKNLTTHNLEITRQTLDLLTDHAENIGENIFQLRYNRKPHYFDGIEEWDLDEITVIFGESHCGCCPDDTTLITFPISYLRCDYVAIERTKMAESAAKLREERLQKEQESKVRAEEAERLRYLQLKEKYEDNL
jgi:hypothetical protein